MGEWAPLLNIAFAVFMALSTALATLFASNVRTGFAKADSDIRALYEKREADLDKFHRERVADLERFLRELYDHKLEDVRAFGEAATRTSVHDLRNETGNHMNAMRAEFSANVKTLRDDVHSGFDSMRTELQRRRQTDNRDSP